MVLQVMSWLHKTPLNYFLLKSQSSIQYSLRQIIGSNETMKFLFSAMLEIISNNMKYSADYRNKNILATRTLKKEVP